MATLRSLARPGVFVFMATFVCADDAKLPATSNDVFAWTVLAQMPDQRVIEGLVFVDRAEAKGYFCASHLSVDCVGAFEPGPMLGLQDIVFLCDNGLAGTLFATPGGRGQGLAPRRAFGRTDTGQRITMLFGPIQVKSGAACRSRKAATELPPKEEAL